MLTRAGERAASLAANDEAQHYFERAAELADDPLAEAAPTRTCRRRLRGPRDGPSRRRRTSALALELYEAQGLTHPAARVSASLGVVEWRTGRLEEAVERMERGVRRSSPATRSTPTSRPSPPSSAGSTSSRARSSSRPSGSTRRSRSPSRSGFPSVLSHALNTQGLIAGSRGRFEQARALITHALGLALENDLAAAALRAYNNLGDLLDRRDRYEEAIGLHATGARARPEGRRPAHGVDADRGARLLLDAGRPLERVARAHRAGSAGTTGRAGPRSHSWTAAPSIPHVHRRDRRRPRRSTSRRGGCSPSSPRGRIRRTSRIDRATSS